MRRTTTLLIGCALVAFAVAQIPDGFSTFFQSATCPDGWEEAVDCKGRLLVSVTNPTDGGITVGDALADQEDRLHSHAYSATLDLPYKEISADDCCNSQGACAGTYTPAGNSSLAPSGLPFSQLIFCTIANATVSGGVPFGTIGYFLPTATTGSYCPSAWEPLDEAAGRILVPGYDDVGLISSDTAPLSSGEDRTHKHSFSCPITTDSVEYAGIAGCCNDNIGADGTYQVEGDSNEASSGLPYIQLLTCVYQNHTDAAVLPVETLLFNEVSCDVGWNVTLDVAGRFLVALPEAGVPGIEFGAESLPPDFSGNNNHTHQIAGDVTIPDCEIGLISGCCADGYAKDQTYDYQCAASAAPVDLPYLVAPLCMQVS